MNYPVVIHKDTDSDFGVTVPDLPGCFSVGRTMDDALTNAAEAIITHVEGLLLDREPVPEPTKIESRAGSNMPPVAPRMEPRVEVTVHPA